MTVSEIHKAFKVQMDKNAAAIAFGGCPAFLPEEIDLFLNQAYIEVINNKFTGNNRLQQPFEQSVKRIADLYKLIKTDKDVDLQYTDSSSNVLIMPNFFKEQDSDATTNKRMFYVDCVLHFGSSSANCMLIDHASTKRFLQTYDNLPWIQTPVAALEDNTLKIYFDPKSMVVDDYSCDITYVKYPEVIDNTKTNIIIDEVPDYVLYEVINRAVVIALENIESQRSQTKLQINTLEE